MVVMSCTALSSASAYDLANALSFASEVMGDEIREGFEDFNDTDPDEALALLLDVGADDPSIPIAPKRVPAFQTLGKTRLSLTELSPIIYAAARETGLPPALIDAVIRTESGYRPGAVSRVGAMGLMQLMPRTAQSVGVTDAFDPRQNVLGGARYLKKQLDRFGSVALAAAAYNAGPGRVAKYKGIPPFRETRRYVKAVLSRFENSKLR